ncbi:MAG: CRTAC1 family protein [Capsulimonadales bacterium]|nr:CRTAC1 family protein [Capsulimonadales bacterium]
MSNQLRRTAIGFGLALSVIGCQGEQDARPSGGSPSVPTVPSVSTSPGFREVAAAAGIRYEWRVNAPRPLTIRGTIGNGCAFLDFDSDGNLDVLLVGSPPALFRGDGKGKFVDVSSAVGLSGLSGEFLGCAVGDPDNDGDPDVYLTAFRGGVLLRNEGGKVWKDVSRTAGIPPQPWGTSSAFGDVDNDGFLDLFVGNYVAFDETTKPQRCDYEGRMSACGPRYYAPRFGKLYRNRGDGTFADITEATGANRVSGKALGVALADFDGMGRPGIALANDEMPGDLLRTDRSKTLRFRNVGPESGTAFSASGTVHGGMGIDWGDFNNDGAVDLFVGTFQREEKCVYRNDGGVFTEVSGSLGLAPANPYVTFGAKWVDFDNDGWLDLAIANGHIQDNIADIDRSATYRQPILLFRNRQGQAFEDWTDRIDPNGRRPIVGRGLATGDYDNDGRTDLLVVDSEGTPLLLHNEVPQVGHSLLLRLQGKKSNRMGLGARIEVRVGGESRVRFCRTDGSYMSASDGRVSVGLGTATKADSVTVRWPGGHTTVLRDVTADRQHVIRET